MADSLLVRDVPEELYRWIQNERTRSLLTQNEFVLSILRDAFNSSNQLPLFLPKRRMEVVPGALPFTFIDLFATGSPACAAQDAGRRVSILSASPA